MTDKLDMALDDMIPKKTGRGKGGGGGKMGAPGGRGAGKQARSAMAAPYQKPVKGKGKGNDFTLASMTQAAEMAGAAQPAFTLTTGTAVRVGNLDFGVSAEDVQELFEQVGPLKEVNLLTRPDGSSKGVALITFRKKADAETAIEQYNGVPLDGRPLKISLQQKVGLAQPAAANIQVTTGGRGAGREVAFAGGFGKGKGGRGKGFSFGEKGGKGFSFGEKGGKGKGKGKGGGKGGGGRGGGAPASAEDLDAELDAYRAGAAKEE